jgi:2-iminobutanoate/2-iminopropanoate deaminase
MHCILQARACPGGGAASEHAEGLIGSATHYVRECDFQPFIRESSLSSMCAIRYVDVPGYPAAHSPYSHAVVANGFVFVSGQIAVRPGGGATEIVGDTMQEQTRQALRNVQTVLEAAGSSLDRVVKVTVLLSRPDLYREMNEAYAEFFPESKPARSMARFGADIPGVLVAIEAIALA